MDQRSHDLERARAQDLRLIGASTVALIVCLVVLGTQAGNLNRSKGSPVGVVVPEGTIQRRPARSLEWVNVDQQSQVYVRDSIYTPAGASAQIQTRQGKVIDLRPNTLVKMVELSPEDSRVEVLFGQAEGLALAKVEEPERFRNIIYSCQRKPIQDLPDIALEGLPGVPKKFAMRSLAEAPRLAAFLPMDKLDYYDVKIRRPANKSVIEKGNFWVPFSWTAVPVEDVVYELEVSKDTSFTNVIGSKNARNGQYVLVNKPGTYFARIKAVVDDDEVISPTIEFKVLAGQKISGANFQLPKKK